MDEEIEITSDHERLLEHIVCPICRLPITENRKLTKDIEWDRFGCHNEWIVHKGTILYERTFHGHRFLD